MSHVEFDHLERLHLLWIVAAVGAAGVYGIWQRRRALRRFATSEVLPRLAPDAGWLRPLLRLGLVLAGLTSLVGAIIGPRWGEREQILIRRGLDIMVLLDVSRSMLARDLVPDRLERAKLAIRDELLPELGGDRIGLMVFAGVPSLQCPLTSDYGFFRLALEDVSTESVPRGGTLIGDAIRRAAEAFRSGLDTHKLVILITDGEDHESYPVDAARALWNEHRIPIVAIGLGDEREGARVPVSRGGPAYLEYRGQTVWSRARFDQLRQIAAASPLGVFIPAGTRQFDLGEIYRTRIVPAIEHAQREERERVPLPSRYHPFAVTALVLLTAESLLREGPAQSPKRRAGLLHPGPGAAPAPSNAQLSRART